MREHDELILACMDRRLSNSETSRFQQLFRSDEAFVKRFAAMSILHRHLTDCPVMQIGLPLAGSSAVGSGPRCDGVSGARWSVTSSMRFRAIAAALLLSAAAVAVYAFLGADPGGSSLGNGEPDTAIATLIDATSDVIVNNEVANPGSDYRRGVYSIESGEAEFLLTSRVAVHVSGPSRLYLRDHMAAALERGSATFTCPPGAKGYTVYLPGGGRIVDLGTEFTARVADDGSTRVFVHEGQVEIVGVDGAVQPVRAGEGYGVSAQGVAMAVTRRDLLDAIGPAVLRSEDYAAAILENNPIAYWPLTGDDAADRDRVSDHPSKLVGVTFGSEGPVAGAGAALFDGTGHIDLGERADLLIDGPLTIEAWVWIEPGANDVRLFSLDRGGPIERVGWGIGLRAHEGRYLPRFTHYRVKDYNFDDAPMPMRRWVHLAFVLTESEVRLLVDGQDRGSQQRVGPLIAGPASASFGRLSDGTQRFRGRLASLAIYPSALTDAQIESRLHPER